MTHFGWSLLIAVLMCWGLTRTSAAPPGRGNTANKESPGKQENSPAGNGQQQQNLKQLQKDLEAIYGKSSVTPAQKQTVKNDLKKILSGANKPSEQSIEALATDLTRALADKEITPQEAMRLANDVSAVLASANISQQDAKQLMADVQALLRATNVTKQDAQKIYNDVNAIVTTAQKNAQNAKKKSGK